MAVWSSFLFLFTENAKVTADENRKLFRERYDAMQTNTHEFLRRASRRKWTCDKGNYPGNRRRSSYMWLSLLNSFTANILCSWVRSAISSNHAFHSGLRRQRGEHKCRCQLCRNLQRFQANVELRL